MATREFSSSKRININVEAGQLVTLELTVSLTFALPEPISAEREIQNALRLMNSGLRHSVADELEQTWLGTEPEPETAAADPEQGDPALEIGEATEPLVPPAPKAGAAHVNPSAFSPNRRSGQPLTAYQQIVLYLESPRFGFSPDERERRLAFTAWLGGYPGLELSSTTDLRPEAAERIQKRLSSERQPLTLIAQWENESRQSPPTAPGTGTAKGN